MIKFTVYGEPVAQGRPRAVNIGGHIRIYDPKKSSEYKQYIRLVASQEVKGNLLTGAICLKITFYRSIPKSFSKKKTEQAEAGIIRPITKPDTDNYTKAVKDALKGVAWKDDSQVVDEHCRKFYSNRPRIEIEIWEVNP